MSLKNKKSVFYLIGISAVLIFIGYLGSMNSKEYYNMLILPDFAPPSVVFSHSLGNNLFSYDCRGSYN